MKTLLRFICLALTFTIVSPALGQETSEDASTENPAGPQAFCEDDDGFSDWDFWVGEWNVYTNNEERTHVGTNSITAHYAHCLIKEMWLSTSGSGGFSINFYNPVRSQWRQVWVANGYSIDYTGGLNDQGQMVLEGEIDNYAPKVSQRFRGIWTPQENGDVIQHFDIYDAENEKWDVWFEGLYVKKETDPNPPARHHDMLFRTRKY